VLYSKDSSKGQWRAHGRYIARESASEAGFGFSGGEESIDIPARLEGWQKTSDERLWKLIVSPEFGDRVDLKRLTRDLMAEVETDLGMPLEWVAVVHFNTEHPHVHVALRGIGATGRPVLLSRDFVREGIRHIAEDYCTRQLGFRTDFDAADAQRREVHQPRYTFLDRIIQRDAEASGPAESPFFTVSKDTSRAGLGPTISLTERRTAERLMFLASMGLAESAGPKTWRVRRDFASVLRATQRTSDWQKTLAAHGALISDERLPLNVLDLRDLTTLEGRILVHGEEERSGRGYLLLEGTDARVHFIYYTPDLEAARNAGGLRTNAFTRLRKFLKEGELVLDIDEIGDADSILRNKPYLRETARQLARRGIVPRDDGWNGWLGNYQRALQDAASRHQRGKGRDLGR
jgi:hypothetical protein